MKLCKYCGETYPEEHFRKYYGGREGRYTFCKTCESIMQRQKYLKKLVDRTAEQEEELQKIELLYKYRAEAGLTIPGSRFQVKSVIEDQLSKIKKDR